MKITTIACAFLLSLAFSGTAQKNCQTFETYPISTTAVSSIGNWVMYNSSNTGITSPARIRIQAGNGGKIITASDASGATYLLNRQDYDGNWLANGNTCFCFDIKLISDGGTYSSPLQVSHGIRIFQNLNSGAALSASNPQISFAFNVTPTYNENDPWRRVCLPVKLLNPGDPLPSNIHGQWVAGNLNGMTPENAWNTVIQNVTEVGFFVDATSNNQNEVIGLDNICLGCDETKNTCCPTLENLINNSDFSNIATPLGFNSNYTYDNGSPALSSLLPGEYTITNTTGAAAFCPNWPPVKDHTTCPVNGNGNFLVVNGSTGQSVAKKLVWEQTINNLAGNSEYKFCAQFKNLPQCCFDIKPKVDVKFLATGLSGVDLMNQTINVTSSANCGWIELSKTFTLPSTGNLTIQIWLDESAAGDGNDLAIDDIAFYTLPQMGYNYAVFGVSQPTPHPAGGSFYQITFTHTPPVPPVPAGCSSVKCAWSVCELDPNTNQCKTTPNTTVYNDPLWWPLPNYCNSFTFNGYDGTSLISPANLSIPGKFDIAKTYRITRGVWCECMGWQSVSYDIFEKNKMFTVQESETRKIIKQYNMK